MSSHQRPDAEDPDDSHFESDPYEDSDSPVVCARCGAEIEELYYTLNSDVLCVDCRDFMMVRPGADRPVLSFVRAGLFGTIASFLGFVLWLGVWITTQRQYGLIAILVGYLVGKSVRIGSYHRGGWVYQTLAVFLTYCALAASYTGFWVVAMHEELNKAPHVAADANRKKPDAHRVDPAKAAAPAAPAKDALAGRPVQPQPKPEPKLDPAQPMRAAPTVLQWITFVGYLFALPLNVNFQAKSPFGLAILGFGLWKAWKINRIPELVFHGPFELAEPEDDDPDEFPTHEVPGDD